MRSILGNGVLLLPALLADLGWPVWMGERAGVSFVEASFAISLCLSPGMVPLIWSGFFGLAADLVAGQQFGLGIVPFATVALLAAWRDRADHPPPRLLDRLLYACLAVAAIALGRSIVESLAGRGASAWTGDVVLQAAATCLLTLPLIAVCHGIIAHRRCEYSSLSERSRGML